MNEISFPDLFSLRNRVALITGASGGIGRAMAQGLAAAGATVALHGRSPEKLHAIQETIEQQGGQAACFPGDLSEAEHRPLRPQQVVHQFGTIDILVNCAGINNRMPIEQVTPEIYHQIMNTNLHSVYFLSQAVMPYMRDKGGGKIIHVGSLTTGTGLADVSVYGMTKGALGQLTKTMAIEWAPYNIQINCLCPGFIQTELTQTLWNNPQKRQWMLDRLPIKRAGRPEDLVGLLIYLASQASNYMTGQAVYIDGGFMAGSQW